MNPSFFYINAYQWITLANIIVCSLLLIASYHYSPQENKIKNSSYTFLFLSAWIIFCGVLAYSGLLSDFSKFPPPAGFFIISNFALVVLLAFSKPGNFFVNNLSFEPLIAFHTFRFLPEFMIYSAYLEKLAPIDLSFLGYNHDILTAITAPIVALAVFYISSPKIKYRLILIWNILGLFLVLKVVSVGVLSLPLPIRQFFAEVDNTWITRFPYIYLVSIQVFFAVFGHLIIFRMLKQFKNKISIN
ncbi:hypothetical protein MJH12_15720 [bacterium]|nr:hypothetical protein [bacterium]